MLVVFSGSLVFLYISLQILFVGGVGVTSASAKFCTHFEYLESSYTTKKAMLNKS